MQEFKNTIIRLLAVVAFAAMLFLAWLLYALMVHMEGLRMLISIVNVIGLIINISLFIALISAHKKFEKEKNDYMV